jgi:hypothetical protein
MKKVFPKGYFGRHEEEGVGEPGSPFVLFSPVATFTLFCQTFFLFMSCYFWRRQPKKEKSGQ